MPDTVDATVARRQFGRLVKRVAAGERVVVEARGRAQVAIVSIEDLRLIEAVDRVIRRRGLDQPEDWSALFPGLRSLEDLPPG